MSSSHERERLVSSPPAEGSGSRGPEQALQEHDHHSQYTKLDAERAHYRRELYSWAAARDTLRFVVWVLVGMCVDQIFDHFSDMKGQKNVFDLAQYIWLLLSFTGIYWAFQNQNWWVLALCTGSSFSLLGRDLSLHREGCFGGSLDDAYWWTQRLAQWLSPFVAWMIMLTSRALDRVYGVVRPSADWAKAFKKSWYGLGLLIFGRDIAQDWRNLWNRQPVPSLPMTVRSEKDPKKEIPLVFYPDYNATIDDPDMRVKGNLNADVAKLLVDKFKDAEVALIFNDRGGHMVGKLTEWEASAGAFIIRAPHDTYRQIKEAYRSQASEPIILLVFGDKSKPDRRQVLLHADDSVEVTQCAWKWLCSIGLPIVIAVGGAVWWFFDSSWQLGYASIFFLMMPDLIQAFMRNQTHLQSAIKVHSNMTGLLDEEWAILQQGWNCTVQSRTLGSHVAVWDSALFFCGCVLFILVGCYHLSQAADSLNELTGLLHLHDHRNKNLQAVLLYRLHNIRNKTTHRRCLHYISQHSFPDKLEADVSLGWWFETRATIFADVSRSVAKRNIIFGLFMVAECAMIILTCLASLFDTGNDFAVMCYATAYGVGLGLLTLLFMYLASNVNTELQNGLKEVNSSETKDIEQGSPVTMLKRRRDKQAQEAISELLDYERIHPAKLKFMGVPFTIEFLWGYAAPLGTYATGVIYWIVQNTLIHA